jgi:hypothetical protein
MSPCVGHAELVPELGQPQGLDVSHAPQLRIDRGQPTPEFLPMPSAADAHFDGGMGELGEIEIGHGRNLLLTAGRLQPGELINQGSRRPSRMKVAPTAAAPRRELACAAAPR